MAPGDATEVLDPPSGRTRIRAILEAGDALAGRRVVVGGWVRAGREQGDGARPGPVRVPRPQRRLQGNLQLFVKGEVVCHPLARLTATGTSVLVEGEVRRDERAKHGVELAVTRVLEVGEVDAAAYPLPKAKTGHSLDPAYIRDFVHLQASAKVIVKEKGEALAQLNSSQAAKQEIGAAVSVSELNKTKENASMMEERSKLRPGVPRTEDGSVAFENDFFRCPSYLTVSGQLHLETLACALGNVYTFGPTCRAENSHTSRHLAEFWMVEAEFAFANLQDDMDRAESYVRYLKRWNSWSRVMIRPQLSA